MIIEVSKHGINLNENLEYIGTYIIDRKLKKLPENIEQFRILTKGLTTGKERFLFLSGEITYSNFKSYDIDYIDEFKTISPDKILVQGSRSKYYYHKFGYDVNSVEKFFTEWKNSIPMVFTGENVIFNGGECQLKQYITFFNEYTWSYKFNNKSY